MSNHPTHRLDRLLPPLRSISSEEIKTRIDAMLAASGTPRRSEPRDDRRRRNPATAEDYLEQLPALVLLRRLPVPALAVDRHGVISHANRALEQMLGYGEGGLGGGSVADFVDPQSSPNGAEAVAILHDFAGKVIELAHQDGFVVRALVSRSVLLRHDDPITLVCFEDVTERLWDGGRARAFA
ncbi:PAS domain S-box protein [Rhodococcus sp. IEGM 248]|nr:PAS domain S-box protein [Rhodococcus sp. IEGM 248]